MRRLVPEMIAAMFLAAAVVFGLAATLIWAAPRPQRVAAPGGGH